MENNTKPREEKLYRVDVENVSAVQHEAWTHWSKSLADTLQEVQEAITARKSQIALRTIRMKLASWEKTWVPYEDLPEETKELDREWARKVLEALHNDNLEKKL